MASGSRLFLLAVARRVLYGDRVMNDAIKALAPAMPSKYLRDFFAEKDIAEVEWELTAADGQTHFIGNVVVIEHIAKTTDGEARKIGDVIRKIDFANGDVNHFFRHLAGALINA
jgi:hypothetical protein